MAPYVRQFKDEHEFEEWQDRVAAPIVEVEMAYCSCCGFYFEDHDGRSYLCLTCETMGCREDGTGARCIGDGA